MMAVMDRPSAATRPCDRCDREVGDDDGYLHDHDLDEAGWYCAACSILILRAQLVRARIRAASRPTTG